MDMGIDLLGAGLVTAGLTLFVWTVMDAGNAGWGSTRTLLLGLLSVLLLGGFVLRQATGARPLLPLRLFRSRSLAAANVVQFLMIAGMCGLLFFGTLYVQRVLGYGSLAAGLSFVPAAVVIAVVSVGCSARLIARFGQRPLLFGGLGLIAAAFVLLSFARVDGAYLVDFLPASLVMGLGFGLAAPAVMGLGMAAVVPADSGVASGLFNTTQQVGGAIGLTVLSGFAGARTEGLSAGGASEVEALAGGYRVAFLAAAGFVLVAMVVGGAMLGVRGRRVLVRNG
jgi:hypothetical protein